MLREILSDGKGTLSSFRVMAMMGMVTGCAVMLAQAFNWACPGTNLENALMALFAGILGGKAYQKGKEN